MSPLEQNQLVNKSCVYPSETERQYRIAAANWALITGKEKERQLRKELVEKEEKKRTEKHRMQKVLTITIETHRLLDR